MTWLVEYFLILKTLHIIFVVSWFAGLVYIFRLFVYHVREKHEVATCKTFAVMEAKLLKIIMYPASVLVLISGLLLALSLPRAFSTPWLQYKMLAVGLLFVYQDLARRTQRRFERGDYYLNERQCRFINEVPTLLLFLIVSLVVIKPFQD